LAVDIKLSNDIDKMNTLRNYLMKL